MLRSNMIDQGQPNTHNLFFRLGGLLINDYDLEYRSSATLPVAISDDLPQLLWDAVEEKPIIYTAFDGDHQYLSGHMRAFVMKNGGIQIGRAHV